MGPWTLHRGHGFFLRQSLVCGSVIFRTMIFIYLAPLHARILKGLTVKNSSRAEIKAVKERTQLKKL